MIKKVIPIKYLGNVAENLALNELEKRGFEILIRGAECCFDLCDVIREIQLRKYFLGGRIVDDEKAREMGADAYAKDAWDGVAKAKTLMSKKTE